MNPSIFIPCALVCILLAGFRPSLVDAMVQLALTSDPSRDYRVVLRDAERLVDGATFGVLVVLLLSM